MNGIVKPFVCTTEGCKMSFTNEDHLNVHQKKHYMVLNLGLGNKTNIFVADQTPTPTRFIRNCEELGLFQDLQQVNPFEETFRRAVEDGVQPQSESTDDTLHTPHVLPHEDSISAPKFEQNPNKFILNEIDSDLIRIKKRNGSTKSDVIDLTGGVYEKGDLSAEVTSNSDKSDSRKNKVNAKVKFNKIAVKRKLKESLLKNKQQRESESPSFVPTAYTIIPINLEPPNLNSNVIKPARNSITVLNNTFNSSNEVKTCEKNQLKLNVNQNDTNVKNGHNNKISVIRERNRAAAIRCRERKKSWIEKIRKDNGVLIEKNNDLLIENQNLKKEVIYLKTLLLQHKECPVTKAMNMGPEVEKIIANRTGTSNNSSTEKLIAPRYSVQNLPKILPQNTFIISNLNTSTITVIK